MDEIEDKKFWKEKKKKEIKKIQFQLDQHVVLLKK